MQYRPTAAELLDAVATLLERDVLGAVPPHLQHQVRVAGNLCRIVEREVQLAPDADAAEQTRWAALLGHEGSLTGLRAELAARLDDPAPIEPDLDRSIRSALLDTLRADLAISKPGYDTITGAP